MDARENHPPALTAAAAYEDAHLAAQGMVERINDLLFQLPAPGDEERPAGWAHVGALNDVNNRLSDVIAFLESAAQ